MSKTNGDRPKVHRRSITEEFFKDCTIPEDADLEKVVIQRMVRRKACRYKSHEFEPKDWEALLSESNASKRRTA